MNPPAIGASGTWWLTLLAGTFYLFYSANHPLISSNVTSNHVTPDSWVKSLGDYKMDVVPSNILYPPEQLKLLPESAPSTSPVYAPIKEMKETKVIETEKPKHVFKPHHYIPKHHPTPHETQHTVHKIHKVKIHARRIPTIQARVPTLIENRPLAHRPRFETKGFYDFADRHGG